jgi:hypothetical protein
MLSLDETPFQHRPRNQAAQPNKDALFARAPPSLKDVKIPIIITEKYSTIGTLSPSDNNFVSFNRLRQFELSNAQ